MKRTEATLEQSPNKRVSNATQKVQVSAGKVGLIIGRQGSTIRELEARTGSKIRLPQNTRGQDPNSLVDVIVEGGDTEEAVTLIKRIIGGKQLRSKFEGEEQSSVNGLYVDVLNFVDSHFFVDIDDWSLSPVIERVRNFTDAARRSGITLTIFIDSVRTEEALDKWHDRMTRSVVGGARNVPQNISGIMAELFHRHGKVEVRLSTEINNDDTLASHSAHDRVPILSGDKDFLRYVDATGTWADLEIYSDFKVVDGKLHLRRRTFMQLDGKRPLIVDPPGYQRFGVDEDAWVKNLAKTRSFRGGAPSPLVRALQFNPYLRIRPLRIALYKELLKDSVNEPVKEEFPIWDGKTVNFPVEILDIAGPQDDTMVEMLRQPRKAFEHFFPREQDKCAPPGVNPGDWYRHCHGCRVILIELSCYLPENKVKGRSFLEMLNESDQW